jgi:hypothetical protein
MNPFLIGIPVFFAGVLIGYLLREFSVGRLTALDLGTLSLDMRPVRLRYLAFMVAALAAFAVLRFTIPSLMNLWFLIFLSICAIATLGFEVYALRKFIFRKFPRAFMTPYVASRVFTISSMLVLIGTMAATVLI